MNMSHGILFRKGGFVDIGIGRYVPADDFHGADPDAEADGVRLPDGFPFLVDRGTGEIVEPAFRYLYAKVVHARTFTVQSAAGTADNLRLWWGYLHTEGARGTGPPGSTSTPIAAGWAGWSRHGRARSWPKQRSAKDGLTCSTSTAGPTSAA